MSIKTKHIINKIFYISTFNLIFLFIFSFLNLNTIANATIEKEYKNINIKEISQVGVAITTNIGIGDNNKSENKINLYKNTKIFDINTFYTNKEKIKNSLIKNNMLFLEEYLKISKVNFNNIIKKSNNKPKTVKNLITQLKIRYKLAIENLTTLNKQKKLLLSEYERLDTQINNTKRNLEIHFGKIQPENVFSDTEHYYKLKEKQVIIKTNIVFINNFLKKYSTLIDYNKKIINVIELNKDALSKDSYVVIPNSGTDLVKEFKLLYSEDEFKELKKAK